MTEIIREQPFSGRVLGSGASYSPRFDLSTKARLESYWQNGNVDERRETIHIRAKRAVFVGSGGHGANRSMFYPAFNEPAFVSSAWALLGPHGQDASGIIAGMRIGATLAGMQQNLGTTQSFHIPRGWRRATPTPTCCPVTRLSSSENPPASRSARAVRAPDRREPGGQALL